MKKMKVIVEMTNTGYSAYAKDYEIYTTGGNVTELVQNITEAASLHFDEEVKPSRFDFEIDFSQFFNHYRVINSKVLAERIGMNYTLLSQYVNGHKKPSKKQTERIIDGIQEVGRELANINLVTA